MEDSDTQELFLLEFLVDRVNIPSVQAMHDDVLLVKTCIEFKVRFYTGTLCGVVEKFSIHVNNQQLLSIAKSHNILNLPPIYICQDTSHDNCTCLGADAQVFRKGKSCLFALPSKLLKTPLCSFPITMSVYKKLPPTVLPDIMTIGTCQIEIRDMINCLLQESLLTSQNPCKTLKNNFRISTATGQCVGEVCVFIRFSRLGRKVVTQFQNPHNRKPYLFKGAENSPVFQCRKVASTILEEDALKNCVCEKKTDECNVEEKTPRSCCETNVSGRQKKRSESKGKSSRKRPCCPASHKQKREPLRECQSENRGHTPYKSLFETQGEKGTRQCGCEIKEDKSSACRK